MAFPSHILQVGGQVDLLTERQKEVLDLIINDPAISRKSLSKKLNINPSAIQKHINALKQKGIISRESETTGSCRARMIALPCLPVGRGAQGAAIIKNKLEKR
jgi:DNA-binding MarR family transcriptional regulator